MVLSLWTTIYEPLCNDFTWLEIHVNCTLVCHLFAGMPPQILMGENASPEAFSLTS